MKIAVDIASASAAVGATTLALDPIEGVSREQAAAGAGYVELMQANLVALRLGLGCR